MNRLAVNCALICMPAIVLCVAGTYFMVDKLPALAAEHRGIASREYRAVASDMYDDPMLADDFGSRLKGWRQTGKLGRRGRGEKVPWGHVPVAGGELVWCGADERMVAQRTVRRICEPGVMVWFRVGIPLGLLTLLALSVSGAVFFYRYSRSRDDFLAAVAHDLTSPLVGLHRLIGRDDEYAKLLAERMMVIVKNVTSFLRHDGKMPLPEASQFDLADAYREAYRIFAPDFAEEASGEIVVEESVPTIVVADRALVLQVIWNLIGNELKYAASYGRIRVWITHDDGWGVLRISDEGPGMTVHERRHAFDRYYRAMNVMKSGKGGFGIGLCNANELVRKMGGKLTVDGNSPRGCMFELRLKREV